MPSKEVMTFWLDTGAPISLLSVVARLSQKRRMPRQVRPETVRALVAE